MAYIITLCGQKGGTGKSSIAFHLATYFSKEGSKTALVDMDNQGTLKTYFSQQADSEGRISGIDYLDSDDLFNNALKQLELNKNYDAIIIDTPPYNMAEYDQIASISDLMLLPMQPAMNDYYALAPMIDKLNNLQNKYEHLKAAVVMNQYTIGASKAFMNEMCEKIEEAGIPILETKIGRRVSYTRFNWKNNTIFETSDEKAKLEIISLANEVLEISNQ